MEKNLKVKDLPKDEQDKLIFEAQEYDIKGLVVNWGVDTLKAKIEEAKLKKAEATIEAPIESKEESKEEVKEEAPIEDTKTEAKICHICRSKVINGKCSGCGFSIN